jgi:hypothetical protein
MRHKIIRCLDALFIGMILGLFFVTISHASPAPRWEHFRITHAISAHDYAAQK